MAGCLIFESLEYLGCDTVWRAYVFAQVLHAVCQQINITLGGASFQFNQRATTPSTVVDHGLQIASHVCQLRGAGIA